MPVRISLGLFILSFLAACVPASSLHPLYYEKDLVFEPALEGTWVTGTDTLAFRKSEKAAYDLSFSSEGKTKTYTAHLMRLGELTFLDLYPQASGLSDEFLMIPVHSFFKVSLEGDLLHLPFLDNEWLAEMVNGKKVEIGHELLTDETSGDSLIVLTASTGKLQEFVLKYAGDPEAFPDVELRRVK